jgi:hypothetical protein
MLPYAHQLMVKVCAETGIVEVVSVAAGKVRSPVVAHLEGMGRASLRGSCLDYRGEVVFCCLHGRRLPEKLGWSSSLYKMLHGKGCLCG